MECPSCGQFNDPGLKFCVACGATLSGGSDSFGSVTGDSLLAPGTILKSTYEVIRLIGEGGAGAVYEGRHIDLGHPVAVKVLFGQLARIGQIRERFVEEGRIQANLRHPNIVRVTDIVDDGRIVAIVMEYVDGETLHHYIQRLRKPIDLNRAAQLLLCLLGGLKAAHDRSIVHRDIKPGNVMLAQSDLGLVPKLCDFGIAKVASAQSRTITGTKMGTLHYMAPEQFQDARRVDRRADIYSLGVTFYELVTGRLPFDTDNDYQLMRSHIEVDPPSLRGIRPDISGALDTFVLKALAKGPEHRYQSCDEMAASLTSIAEFRHLHGVVSMPGVPISDGLLPAPVPAPRPQPPPRTRATPSTEHERPGGARSPARGATPTPVRPATRASARAATRRPARAAPPRPEPSAKGRHIPWLTLIIGALAAAVAIAVTAALLPRNDEPPSRVGGIAAVTLSDDKLAGDEPPDDNEGSGTAAAEPAPVAPAEPPAGEPLSATTCAALADELEAIEDLASLEPDRAEALLSRLESADDCRGLMLSGMNDDPFGVLYQQTQADQILIAKYVLRASFRATSAEDACMQILPARRVFDRALTRLQQAIESEQWQPFEIETMRELGNTLYERRARLQTRYYQCP